MLRTGTLLAYAVPSFALSAPYLLVQFYLLNFGTDVLLIEAATMGLLLGGVRLWDAISDPLVGWLSDRTRSRLGRRRPWMLAGAPLFGLSFAMLWSPPVDLSSKSLEVWVLVWLLVFTTAFTAWLIPDLALGTELSDEHHARSKIFGTRAFSLGIGSLCSFAGIQIISNAPDSRAAATDLAHSILLPIVVLLLVPPIFVRERLHLHRDRPTYGVRSLIAVVRSRRSLRLLEVWTVDQIGFAVQGVLAPFFMIYTVERPDLIGFVPLAFFLPANLSIPIWVRLSRRFGKRDTWLCAMVMSGLGFGGTVFVGSNDIPLLVAMLIVAGAGSGCATAIGPSVLADVIDDDELETGERKEGAYAAAWLLSIKLAGAAVAVMVGVSLELSGFVPGIAVNPTTDLTIRWLFAGVPFVAFGGGAILFRNFPLDAAEHARIRAELAKRRQSPDAG